MCRISVIVPVYMVEKYLKRCVQSILDQTFQDFELILVDDGSPDGCPALCDGFADEDSRIIAVHKQNGGLSSARNAGMKIAKGRFFCFVDSDDYIHPSMLELLYNACRDNGSQISLCDYKKVYDGDCPPSGLDAGQCEIWSNRQTLLKLYDTSVNAAVVAWCKLYARELFEGIWFPEGCLHEDVFTTYKLYYRAERIAYLPLPLYYYYQSPNSIMRSRYSLKRLVVFTALEERMAFFEKKGLAEQNQRTQVQYIVLLMEHFYLVKKNHPAKKDILKELKSKLIQQTARAKRNPHFLARHKLACFVFFLSPGLFHFFYMRKIKSNEK